jgi:tRNA 2-selenouridine synthase
VLGDLPQQPQPSQKMFESRLLKALTGLDASRPVFVEGESKKIGQIQVPEALIARMRASPCVRLESSLETRVALLLDEYRHFVADPAALGAQLDCLVALHGSERIAEWKSLAARGQWSEFVRRLLVEHYDPAYLRSSHRNFAGLDAAGLVRLESAQPAAFEKAAQLLIGQTREALAA